MDIDRIVLRRRQNHKSLFCFTSLLILFLLPLFSFSQVIDEPQKVLFTKFETRIIKGEKYSVYPEQWEPGGEPLNILYDSLPDGNYVICGYDTNKFYFLFKIKNFKPITSRFFNEDGTSQVWNDSTNFRYQLDEKNKLYEEDLLSKTNEFYIINTYDSLGNKIISNGNGKFFDHYKNGRKASKGKYKNGLLDGKYCFWYENGKLGEKSVYKNGEKIRPEKLWDNDGKRLREKKKTEDDGRGIIIKGIKFDKSLSHLDTTSYKSLSELIEFFKKDENKKDVIEFSFHTAYNTDKETPGWIIGVINFFINNGIDANRIIPYSYSNAKPLIAKEKLDKIKNLKRKNKLIRRNQRIEYKILKK